MELSEVVHRRRMTRSFATTPIESERLRSIFAAAVRAPSAGFTQGAEFLLLTTSARRELFWQLVAEPGWEERSELAPVLTAAPAIALCLVDRDAYGDRFRRADKSGSALGRRDLDVWPVDYPTVDAGFATMIALLVAEDAGLGALFFHLQGRERSVLDGLGVPGRFATIGALAIGERNDDATTGSPRRLARRAVTDRVHLERFADAR
jgi:nitroreductase